MSGGRSDPGYLVVGHITKPHGTRGELQVWPLTDRPDSVFARGAGLVIGDTEGGLGEEPQPVIVEASRPFKRGLLVKLAGAGDRDEAAGLAGRYLLAPLSKLEPLGEGEVFYHQLLGMTVQLVDGTAIGRVREVFENAPADLLEIETETGKTVLVPFAAQIVKEVDVAAGRVVIDPPLGLLDL